MFSEWRKKDNIEYWKKNILHKYFRNVDRLKNKDYHLNEIGACELTLNDTCYTYWEETALLHLTLSQMWWELKGNRNSLSHYTHKAFVKSGLKRSQSWHRVHENDLSSLCLWPSCCSVRQQSVNSCFSNQASSLASNPEVNHTCPVTHWSPLAN